MEQNLLTSFNWDILYGNFSSIMVNRFSTKLLGFYQPHELAGFRSVGYHHNIDRKGHTKQNPTMNGIVIEYKKLLTQSRL